MVKDFDNLSIEDNCYDKQGKNICLVIKDCPDTKPGTMVIFFNDCLIVDKIAVIEALRLSGYKPRQDLADVLGNDIILYEMC